jgi:hypothetical protein
MTYDDREAAKWRRTYGTNTNIIATAVDGETVRIGSRVWTAYSDPMGWGTIVAVADWDFHTGPWFVVTMDDPPKGQPVGTPHRMSLDGTRLATGGHDPGTERTTGVPAGRGRLRLVPAGVDGSPRRVPGGVSRRPCRPPALLGSGGVARLRLPPQPSPAPAPAAAVPRSRSRRLPSAPRLGPRFRSPAPGSGSGSGSRRLRRQSRIDRQHRQHLNQHAAGLTNH